MSQWAKDTAILLGILILGISLFGLLALVYAGKVEGQPIVTAILTVLTSAVAAALSWFASARATKAENAAEVSNLRAENVQLKAERTNYEP